MALPTSMPLARMIRSGLRRYPAQIARSVMNAARHQHREHADLLHAFADPPAVAALWLGHATVLLRLAGRWILTDPVFSARIGPRVGSRTIGVARLAPLPIELGNLPPIDLILLSHAHFDHLDRPTLRALADERTKVITAPRTADLIPPGYAGVVEIGPGEAWREHGIRITAFEPAHWGSRVAWDRWRGCNAYLIESDEGRYFYAGDTAETRGFDNAGRVDLAIFGVGAYDPWVHAHATPEQVWRMAGDMGAERVLPVHHSTFELSDEPIDEPMERLREAASRDSDRVVEPGQGELWTPG